METVSAKKNTIRWSPTRALLWERWRTSGWLALGACAVPWVGGVLLWLNPSFGLAEFLDIAILLAFVALAIVLLVHRSGRDLAMGIPAHQLRLPVRTARLALLNYGYALFWVALFIVPPAVIAQMSPSLRVTGWSFHLGNLIICAILVIVFVWAHVVSWTPVVRQSVLLFGVALALVAMPLGLVSIAVSHIIEAAHLPEAYAAYLWCLAGLGFAVAGYFASWGMLALERRYGATTGGELAFSTPQSTSTLCEPFESRLHAQTWFEYRRLMVELPVFLVLLFVGIISAGLSYGVLVPTNVLEITVVVKSLTLFGLSTGAFVIGMLMLSRDHLLGTRHRAFLFARPFETRHMARARLRALLRVTVILLGAAVLVEGVHQWALHAEARKERARVSERREQRGPTPHMGLPSREQMESQYLGESLAFEGWTRISLARPEWFIIAAIFTVLIWSCLSDPVAMAVIFMGPVLVAEIFLRRSPSTILFYAFAALFAGLYLYTAWAALRQDLVRWRTVALCVAASVVVLLATPSDAPEWWGDPALPRPRPFVALLLTAPLLPFTVIPLWLHRQRHR